MSLYIASYCDYSHGKTVIFCLFLQVVEKSRLGFKRTEAFLEAHVDSFVEQIGSVHKALLWVLRQPEYEEFCVCCICITESHACW